MDARCAHAREHTGDPRKGAGLSVDPSQNAMIPGTDREPFRRKLMHARILGWRLTYLIVCRQHRHEALQLSLARLTRGEHAKS